jgi:hypothetical protein
MAGLNSLTFSPFAVLAVTVAVGVVGCSSSTTNRDPRSSTQHSASAPAGPIPVPAATTPHAHPKDDIDFSRLLLEAADLTDAEDTFAIRSSTVNPNGMPGASALFVNANDTRAISDTFAVYPDVATATEALRGALSTLDTVVADGSAQSSPVGTDGTAVKGTSLDGAKAVTLLLFTQGPALVRLRFDSAPGDTTTDQFVTSVGKMQQIALRVGLPVTE